MTRRWAGLLVVLLGCPSSSSESTAPSAAVTEQTAAKSAASPPAEDREVVFRAHRAMGTQIGLTAYTARPDAAVAAFDTVFAEFRRLEGLLTTWRPDSEVSQINRAAGKDPVKVSPETFEVVRKAVALGRATDGKFDVTFGALSGLWKFDHDQDNKIPDIEAVRARLPLVDYRQIVLDESAQTVGLKKAGMKLHLGGIGKGYGVDRAVGLLKAKGFSDFMVQAGGDMYVAGKKGDRPWRIGIRDPRGPRNEFFAAAEVTDATFSTSGDYERYFIKNGRRYHHILDPTNGQPAAGTRSVTVMAPDAMTADALSTGLLILGVSRGLEVVSSIPGVGAVFIDDRNRVHVSPRLEGKIKRLGDPTDGI